MTDLLDIDIDDIDETVGRAALAELRGARRRNRLVGVAWFDVAYKVYLTAIVGIVVTLSAAGAVGDTHLDQAGLDAVVRNGPAIIGLLVSIAMGIGLRSGSRGGPLAVEAAELRHVLLAPVGRRHALATAAAKTLRHAAFLGAVVGAVAGVLVQRRLGGSRAGWAAAGAGSLGLAALTAVSAALVASGVRMARWVATLLAALLLAGGIADVATRFSWPLAAFGHLAIWPLHAQPIALVVAVLPVGFTIAGILLLNRLSLEQAERRTTLVGQLRFAVTLQDLRTVLVLRRQLTQDQPRATPWFAIPGRGRWPSWRRGWHGLARYPAARLIRLLLLGGAAGLAGIGVYRGTTPLIVASGAAFYLAGLDAVEALAQEVDQDLRADSLPTERGLLHARHLPIGAVISALAGLVAFGVAALVSRQSTPIAIAAVVALPAAWAGAAGAAVSVVQGAPQSVDNTAALLPPEAAGMKVLLRAALPPLVSIAGGLPLLAARRAVLTNGHPVAAAAQAEVGLLMLLAFVVSYVRFRDAAHVWWRSFLKESQQSAKQRPAATAVRGPK